MGEYLGGFISASDIKRFKKEATPKAKGSKVLKMIKGGKKTGLFKKGY